MADKALLTELIKPAVEAAGMEFWGLEFIAGRRSLLRIYIDHAEGVDVDDCAQVSHQVSGVMEVSDPIKAAYRLEVSSPGWDRPLFVPEQYPRFIGAKLKIRTIIPQEGRRNFAGELLAVEDDSIRLQLDAETQISLKFDQIDKAHIVPDVEAEMRNKK